MHKPRSPAHRLRFPLSIGILKKKIRMRALPGVVRASIAAEKSAGHCFMGMITEFRRHIVPAVIKPMRVVWNQSIAFLFLALTVIGAFMVYREYQRREAMDALLALVMGGLFVALMAFYGLSSLWKARKISRS